MIRACIITGAVIGLIFCMLFAATAWSHDDASWIQRGSAYKRTDGISCCGVQDCRKLEPGAWMQDRQGRWIVDGRVLPAGLASYPSETPEAWICERGGAGGDPLCFFPPVAW